MKLLFCPRCRDVKKLRTLVLRRCQCGATAGFYKGGGLRAVVSEDAVVIGIDNMSLVHALLPDKERRPRLEAWIISSDSPRIERRKEVELTAADKGSSRKESDDGE